MSRAVPVFPTCLRIVHMHQFAFHLLHYRLNMATPLAF